MTGSNGGAPTTSARLADRRFSVFRTVLGGITGLLFLLVALTGCSLLVREVKEHEVTRAQYHDFWPFTIEDGGIITCLNPTGKRQGEAIFKADSGITYALNETAEKAGYAPIDPIRADNPRAMEFKLDITSFIQLAEGECFK